MIPPSVKTATIPLASLFQFPPFKKSLANGVTFRIVISTCKEAAVKLDATSRSDLRVYTDGSKAPTGIGAAAVLSGKDSEFLCKAQRFLPGNHLTSIDAECLGLCLGMELLRRQTKRFSSATIFVDNTTALESMHHQVQKAPHTVRNHMRVRKDWGAYFEDGIARIMHRHRNATLSGVWIPSHSGIYGNILADREARRALMEKPETVIIHKFNSGESQEMKKELKRLHDDDARKRPGGGLL